MWDERIVEPLTVPAHGVGEGDVEEVVVLDEQPLHDGGQACGKATVIHTPRWPAARQVCGGVTCSTSPWVDIGERQEGCAW